MFHYSFNRLRSSVEHRVWSSLYSRRDFRTPCHIVVFESDDWGSIRMPSIQVLNELKEKGCSFSEEIGYDKFDTLATEEDLKKLIDALCLVKDNNGNYAKITLNCVMSNPDFTKIKADNFQNYHYELFTDTLAKQPKCKNSFNLWLEGIKLGVFVPQFHGREHLNVQLWMRLLQDFDENTRKAFDKGVFSMLLNNNLSIQKHVLSAYNISQENEKQFLVDSIQDGLNIFEKIFGFKSKSMIAPCYTWDFDVERISNQSGVLFIQGTRVQNHSVLCHSNSSFHYLGERNCLGQTYLIRNCVFEPSSTKKSNMYSCLSQIENAFNHQNPAIVSVHRQNFIGSLNEQNRENNLIQFQNLLKNIVNKYPDVIFMSSDELGEFISNNTIS